MKKVLLILLSVVLFVAAFLLVINFFGKEENEDKNENNNINQVEQVDQVKQRDPFPEEFLHDQDRDGLTDEQEKEYGTSDVEIDTDGDGIVDKTEIEIYKTDPTNPDTDGDGFWDGLEIMRGYNPLE